MPHIQSSPQLGLPVVNEMVRLCRPSTGESTASSVTLVRSNNQDQLADQRPRSTSRGRGRQYQSSGIGGSGNIRASSTSSERTPIPDGPDDFSSTRGREPRSPFRLDKIISIGRGGSGNIRSPSRDVVGVRPSKLSSILESEQIKYERELILNHEATRTANLHSGGRGGVGNMVRRASQSRSLSRSGSQGARTHQRAASREELSRATAL